MDFIKRTDTSDMPPKDIQSIFLTPLNLSLIIDPTQSTQGEKKKQASSYGSMETFSC
jgi:hypothetical protein